MALASRVSAQVPAQVSATDADSPAASQPLVLTEPLYNELDASQSDRAARSDLWDSGGFPTGHLFEPFIADPRHPVMQVALQHYGDDEYIRNGIATGIGASIPFWRDADRPWMLEAGMQAGVFGLFDEDTPSRNLFNTDFVVSAYFSARKGRQSFQARLLHESTHLGDEFMIDNPDVERENFSIERLDLFASRDFFGDYGTTDPRLRLYGGIGVIPLQPSPSDWGNWSFEWGAEATGGETFGSWRPVAAVSVKQQQGNNFDLDVSLRLGLQRDAGRGPGTAFRLLGEFYNGRNVNGQFWRDNSQYAGFGVFIQI